MSDDTEAWGRAEELAEQLRPRYFDNLVDFDADELLKGHIPFGHVDLDLVPETPE